MRPSVPAGALQCGSGYEVRAFHEAGMMSARSISQPQRWRAREVLGQLGDKVFQGHPFRLLSDESVTNSVPVYQGMEHWQEWERLA